MPFGPGVTYKTTYTPGDLFYGLQGPRGKLMDFLNAQKVRTQGAMVNYYNVGDYPPVTDAPPDNAEFSKFLQNSSNPKHPDLLNRWQTNPASGDVRWALWKRKSKSGLWWATRLAAKSIHFCLDELDLDTVINKNYSPGDSPQGNARKDPGITDFTQKKTSITGAELRWIYRNRADPQVQALVQFWHNFVACGAPWEANPKAWAAYIPTNEYEFETS